MAPAKLCKGAEREGGGGRTPLGIQRGRSEMGDFEGGAYERFKLFFHCLPGGAREGGADFPSFPLLRSPALDSHFGNIEASLARARPHCSITIQEPPFRRHRSLLHKPRSLPISEIGSGERGLERPQEGNGECGIVDGDRRISEFRILRAEKLTNLWSGDKERNLAKERRSLIPNFSTYLRRRQRPSELVYLPIYTRSLSSLSPPSFFLSSPPSPFSSGPFASTG